MKLIPSMYGAIMGFKTKLSIFILDLQQNNLAHFPSSKELKEELQDFMTVNFIHFIPILNQITEEFRKRFRDFLLFTSPFTVPIEEQRNEFL